MPDLPPYAQLLQLRIDDSADDGPRFTMPFHENVIGRPGFLHGGAIAGILEFAAFYTLRQQVGSDVEMKPVTVTVDYMRGGIARDTFAAAEIQRLGQRVANVEAFAWQDDRSRPIASARLNFVLDRPDQ